MGWLHNRVKTLYLLIDQTKYFYECSKGRDKTICARARYTKNLVIYINMD